MSLAILVPVLGRPGRVAPLLDAIEATTPGADVLFLADFEDLAEVQAIEGEMGRSTIGVNVEITGGGYAEKINRGVSMTTGALIFTGADDLQFEPGWLEAASAALRDGVEVVGVNDMIERQREHSTHFLMTRAYAERPTIDGQPGPFCTAYHHWNCDDELIATAKHRGAYAYEPAARVLHLHPFAGLAEDDDTYRLGRLQKKADRRIFQRRSSLWA